MKAVLPAVSQHAFYIFRHILKVPFVDKTVNLSGLFIAFVGSVRVIDNAHEPDSPAWEKPVDVFFNKLKLAGKAGLRFAQHNIESARSCVLEKPVEFRPFAVGSGVVVVAVNVVDFPALFNGIL